MTSTEIEPSWWQRLLQRIPSSSVGAWVFSRTLHHVDRGGERHPAWYHNLRVNPEVTGTSEGVSDPYRARDAAPDERDSSWERAKQL